VRSGPLLIGYDGTRAAEHALREAASLLAHRRALIVVVIKPGLAFELIELPASSVGLPPAPIDIHTALEVERKLSEAAQEGAQRAAALARELGLEADPLVVAEEPDVSVAETLLRVAEQRDARAIVLGAHAHGAILGGTPRSVLRDAKCPVVAAREPADGGGADRS
jgi:nucleotide-binding universal stress UspA family protein